MTAREKLARLVCDQAHKEHGVYDHGDSEAQEGWLDVADAVLAAGWRQTFPDEVVVPRKELWVVVKGLDDAMDECCNSVFERPAKHKAVDRLRAVLADVPIKRHCRE